MSDECEHGMDSAWCDGCTYEREKQAVKIGQWARKAREALRTCDGCNDHAPCGDTCCNEPEFTACKPCSVAREYDEMIGGNT